MQSQNENQDRPIFEAKNDLLDRSSLVETLVDTLVLRKKGQDGELLACEATGLVVGLTGPWGSGKSSVLNLVHEALSSESRIISVKFNPWIFKDRDDLLNRFFEALRESIGKSDFEHASSLAADLLRYWRTLEPLATVGAELAGFGTVAKVAKSIGDSLRRADTTRPQSHAWQPEQAKKLLEEAIAKSNCAIVVLIDELDRVEDQEVREVAKLIKSIADFRGISYLVAYDAERVSEALGGGQQDTQRWRGEAYLEKIIHHAIPIRPLFQSDIDVLLTAILQRREGGALPTPIKWQVPLLDCIKKQIRTPRDVKRLEGAYAVLNRAVPDEVCRYDLLAYCWIMTKAPAVQRLIAEQYERLVEGPSIEELSRRLAAENEKGSAPSPKSEFGEVATPHSELLALLFPRLQANPAQDDTDGIRVCVRRNLRRVLYLGYPPDMMQRETLEQIWRTTDFESVYATTRISKQDSLSVLFERLEDVIATLDPNYDVPFWAALSRELMRQSDWAIRRDGLRDLADHAAIILRRLAKIDYAGRARTRKILDALISNGDLAISPILVRKHIHGYGLGTNKERRLGFVSVWDEDEFTNVLLPGELDRYRRAIRDSFLLSRGSSFEPGFALLNMGEFDADLRQELTTQLDSIEAVSSLAALLVPPGNIIDPSSLATLVDLDALKTTLGKLGAPETWEVDPYLRESARRLVALSEGKDLLFFDR